MRKLVLVATILALLGMVRNAVEADAQARDYKQETALYCVWPDGRVEFFILDNDYREFIDPSIKWTVTSIRQHPAAIRVELKIPNRKKYIDFNNGWPCRFERDYIFTNHELDNPESDTFTPLEE